MTSVRAQISFVKVTDLAAGRVASWYTDLHGASSSPEAEAWSNV